MQPKVQMRHPFQHLKRQIDEKNDIMFDYEIYLMWE